MRIIIQVINHRRESGDKFSRRVKKHVDVLAKRMIKDLKDRIKSHSQLSKEDTSVIIFVGEP